MLYQVILPVLTNKRDLFLHNVFMLRGYAVLTLQFLQQKNVKNSHSIYGGGIRTHDLRNMSLLP